MSATRRKPKRRASGSYVKRTMVPIVGIVCLVLLFGACQMVRTNTGGAGAIIVLWLLGMPFLASVLASLKNRSPSLWFFLTLLFGGIPFLVILFLPTVEPPAPALTAEDSRELLETLRELKGRES